VIAHQGSVGAYPASASAQPDLASTIDQLRTSAQDRPQDTSSVLSGVTMAAFTLTEASGAALALESEGSMICCARAGETAPPLGATLDLTSGISGECLRTGIAQLCSDAFTDPRVDAQASRWLGVRSLAAVPLRSQSGVVGILEIFSDRPNVFSGSHTALLQQLAEIAVASTSQQVETAVPEPTGQNADSKAASAAAILSISFSRMLAAVVSNRDPLRLAAAAIVALALLVPLGWVVSRAFHRTPSDSSARAAASPSSVVVSAHAAAEPWAGDANARGGASLIPKPTPAVAVTAKEVVVQASNVDARDRAVPLQVVPSTGTSKPTAESTANTADEPAPPEVSQLPPAPQDNSLTIPAAIVNPSSPLPEENVEISQGVTGGVPLHRVPPIYPEQARIQGIEGTVVLRGIIAENGSLREVKVVSGDAILAFAAKQAVSQWRYSPYRLNGKPVSLPTDITIQFKLPHPTP
jgi:protein TonB